MENKLITEILEWIIRHASDWHLSKADIFSIKLATRAYKALSAIILYIVKYH